MFAIRNVVAGLVLAAILGVTGCAAPSATSPGASSAAESASPPTPSETSQSPKTYTGWYSGTICPGCTSTKHWNNAPADRIYVIGFSPVGASTDAPCEFQTTRTWYRQEPGGEREFWFTIKNIGTIACGTEILLTSVANDVGPWLTGGINPGASTTKHWNNVPAGFVHLVGLNPSGATTTQPCDLEVARSWNAQQPGGEREFWFTIKNVGTITCQANILLSGRSFVGIYASTSIAPGGAVTRLLVPGTAPLSTVFVAGVQPRGATSTAACRFELTSTWYRQVIDPAVRRQFWVTLTNIGAVPCAVDILLESFLA